MATEHPTVGFVSPPSWHDPSPAEFVQLTAGAVRVQQSITAVHDLNYESLESILAALPEVLVAARMLGRTGASCVCMTGTPFGWTGCADEAEMRARNELVSSVAGCPAFLVGPAIIDALRALGVGRVAVYAPYYTESWRLMTSGILKACGIEVTSIMSVDELGLAKGGVKVADSEAVSGPEILAQSLDIIHRSNPDAEALLITGASVRSVSLTEQLEARLGVPVLASDSALYWQLCKHLGLPFPSALGALGRQTREK